MLLRIENIHSWELEHTTAWLIVISKRIEPPTLFMKSHKKNKSK